MRDDDEIRAALRRHGLEAIACLAKLMQAPDTPDAVRLHAADKLLERGFGRARLAPEEQRVVDQVIRWAISEHEAGYDPAQG